MIKKSIYVLFASIIIGGLFFISCDKEDETKSDKSGRLVFSLNQLPAKTGGVSLKSTDAKEDAVAIIVTIMGSQGDTLYYHEKLELYNFNGSFITEAILLPEGSYELTEFLVLDEENNVIYITPIEGSEYAYLVSDPLGISFEVMVNQVTKVVPEVISTDCICTAIDFGYVGFDFDVVDIFCILLNAQIYDETIGNHVFVSANITVEGDGKVIYTGELPARTDSLKLPDGYKQYRLIINSGGTAPFDTLMTNDGIKKFVDRPFEIRWPWHFLVDIEGNLYPVVTICDQVWMASNLRTRTRNDGTTPPNPTPVGFTHEFMDYGDPLLEAEYGLLYSRKADLYAPIGWHVPSDEEWMELERCLGIPESELTQFGERGTNQGDMLKVGGSVGFNALYGGYATWELSENPYSPFFYRYRWVGEVASFRTTTYLYNPNVSDDLVVRRIWPAQSGISRTRVATYHTGSYHSIRCVKD